MHPLSLRFKSPGPDSASVIAETFAWKNHGRFARGDRSVGVTMHPMRSGMTAARLTRMLAGHVNTFKVMCARRNAHPMRSGLACYRAGLMDNLRTPEKDAARAAGRTAHPLTISSFH